MTSLGTEDSDVKPFRGSGHILTTSRSTLVRPMHKKALFRYVASQILFWCVEGLQTTTWLYYQMVAFSTKWIFTHTPRLACPKCPSHCLDFAKLFKYQDCIVIAATLLIWSCWLNISALPMLILFVYWLFMAPPHLICVIHPPYVLAQLLGVCSWTDQS